MTVELRHLTAALIFDPEDAYARRRGMRGAHPRPIGPLSYRLTGRVSGGGVDAFEPPLELRVRRNGSGYDLSFGTVAMRDGGWRGLGEGVYTLRVSSPVGYYQPLQRDDIALPRPDAPYTLDLQPGVAYPFPTETSPGLRGPTVLRGTRLAADGGGVAGVTVTAPGAQSACVT